MFNSFSRFFIYNYTFVFLHICIVQIYYLRYINIEMINAPDIKPIKTKQFESKQSKYEMR